MPVDEVIPNASLFTLNQIRKKQADVARMAYFLRNQKNHNNDILWNQQGSRSSGGGNTINHSNAIIASNSLIGLLL